MILFHIIGGMAGLASGAVALAAPKGARLHRKSGMIFVYAMLVLSVSGGIMAAWIPERISVIAGLLSLYLVTTAWLTVRPSAQKAPWINATAMLFALTTGLLSIIFAIQGLSDNKGIAPIGFIFGAVALLAAAGDARGLLAQRIPEKHRLTRHFWRMCAALWIAAASLFLGQADLLPKTLRMMPLLCTPILLILLLMFY